MAGEEVAEDRSPERLARAGLTRVLERGEDVVGTTFSSLDPIEVWERLNARREDVSRWLPRLDVTNPVADLDRAAASGGRFIIPTDDEWPGGLEALGATAEGGWTNLPFGLWVRGSGNVKDMLARSVALVGARACSAYGEHITGEIAAGLAGLDVTVVSGGAYGVDAAAHRGALSTDGRTVALLACGVDVSYPRGNAALFDRIADQGAIISELPPGSAPTRHRFLTRNRLIAALTLATVVSEAGTRSGSLNIASWAHRCGRPVMAVPGPVTSSSSYGTNNLIREQKASLITDFDDVLVKIDESASVAPTQRTLASRAPQLRSGLHQSTTTPAAEVQR